MATQTVNAAAVEILEDWISSNFLSSRLSDWKANTRHGNGYINYSNILANEGPDAAEAWLAEVVESECRKDFAEGILPIAKSMLEFVGADAAGTRSTVVSVNAEERMLFPTCSRIAQRTSQMVVVFNAPVDGCGCHQPPHAGIFAPMYGNLGLRAITLHAGLDSDGLPIAELGLVVTPQNQLDDYMAQDFNVVTIDLFGAVGGRKQILRFERDAFLNSTFSDGGSHMQPSNYMASGGLDVALPFPGAKESLAHSLENLAEYLSGLAEKINPATHVS